MLVLLLLDPLLGQGRAEPPVQVAALLLVQRDQPVLEAGPQGQCQQEQALHWGVLLQGLESHLWESDIEHQH